MAWDPTKLMNVATGLDSLFGIDAWRADLSECRVVPGQHSDPQATNANDFSQSSLAPGFNHGWASATIKI
ncbi:hypothetical protein EYZ11_007790 [Aspergillus tanneri]|uniref:Uncharacterized protein n=1 Tax=Aspergillus tanneri TaxID=1220188 RepID=A0A4S3JCF0_9EURO|nr:hypothetical protein EYZ11_007790 [Aspergillus tanneri]